MKILTKEDKIGLVLIFIGILLCFAGELWPPLLIVGIVSILIGAIIWDPIGFIFP